LFTGSSYQASQSSMKFYVDTQGFRRRADFGGEKHIIHCG
jgi:hypothetical protein